MASLSLVDYHMERGGMPLHDAVMGAQLLRTKVQVLNLWAMGCMVDNCVCVCNLN